ncbi:MAG: DegT/DnrJ/EryC1/StrS family aminotransferase [Spirochaetia bacterium]
MSLNSKSFIPFAKPSLGEQEEDAVLRVMRSGWLTTGKEASCFEKEFAEYVQTKHALAVNSGTAGLHLALESLGIGPGDKVLTTPFTFTATAEIIRYLGAHVVFADIDPETLNISPKHVENTLKKDKQIQACIPVHIAGLPCNMKELVDICKKYDVKIIEDAAHAFPSHNAAGITGTSGTIGIYSFYATKCLTTGEGGMIVTDDDSLAKRMSVMRLHGIDRPAWDRYTAKHAKWKYEIVAPGYKYNMPDLAASIGRVQLSRAMEMLDARQSIAQKYLRDLGDCNFVELPISHDGHAWHLFIIKLNLEKLTINRDQFIDELFSRGIGSSVHFIPLHLMPYYQEEYHFKPDDFPNSLNSYLRCISLPIYPSLGDEEVRQVIDAIFDIGNRYSIESKSEF